MYGGTAKVLCDIIFFENKCQLCGGTTITKNQFFTVAGKSLELQRIAFKPCEIEARGLYVS